MEAAKADEAGLTRAVTRVARLRRQHRVRMSGAFVCVKKGAALACLTLSIVCMG